MSVVLAVFLDRSTMPSPPAWAKAIRSNGFDLDMDSDFDPASFSGFLPCKYGGVDAGFEFLMDAVSSPELDENAAARIGHRDTRVDFVTHSDLRELAASMIAAGVLCAMSDGVLWETEAGEIVPASRALEWARSGEAGVKDALTKFRPRRK